MEVEDISGDLKHQCDVSHCDISKSWVLLIQYSLLLHNKGNTKLQFEISTKMEFFPSKFLDS